MPPRPGLSFVACGLICFWCVYGYPRKEKCECNQQRSLLPSLLYPTTTTRLCLSRALPAHVNLEHPRAAFLKLWGWDPNWVMIQLGGGSRADKAQQQLCDPPVVVGSHTHTHTDDVFLGSRDERVKEWRVVGNCH